MHLFVCVSQRVGEREEREDHDDTMIQVQISTLLGKDPVCVQCPNPPI